MTKKEMPIMVEGSFEDSLNRSAKHFVNRFVTDIYPIIFKLGLFDDKHIAKYLSCTSTEEIYKDALLESRSKIYELEQMELVSEFSSDEEKKEDVWGFIREYGCTVRKPTDEGFVFRSMPANENQYRELILSGLSVADRQITIDTEVYNDISVIIPTERQKEVYSIIADFCDKINKLGVYKKIDVRTLITSNSNGVFPSVNNILGRIWAYRKKSN